MAAPTHWRLAVIKRHVYTGAVFLVRNAERFFYRQINFFPFFETSESLDSAVHNCYNFFQLKCPHAIHQKRTRMLSSGKHPSRAGFTLAVIAGAEAPFEARRQMLG